MRIIPLHHIVNRVKPEQTPLNQILAITPETADLVKTLKFVINIEHVVVISKIKHNGISDELLQLLINFLNYQNKK